MAFSFEGVKEKLEIIFNALTGQKTEIDSLARKVDNINNHDVMNALTRADERISELKERVRELEEKMEGLVYRQFQSDEDYMG